MTAFSGVATAVLAAEFVVVCALTAPQKAAETNSVDTSNGLVYQEYNDAKGLMPNMNGMGLKDALYLVGNAGLKARVKGSGKVFSQSIPAGSKIGRGLSVQIELK